MTDASFLETFASLSARDRSALIAREARKHNLSEDRLRAMLVLSWAFTGRPKQQEPDGDWMFWYLMAGRGFGKTISAAQWTKKKALARKCRIGLIAPTQRDVRATMVEGETGLLSILPNEALHGQTRDRAWNKSNLELTLANGTILSGFSSEKPDRLRGPQHDYVWGEEVSSWQDANKVPTESETTFANMMLGLRLAERPQACLTSTPKANKLTRALIKMRGLVLVRGSSYENRANLSEVWWNEVVAPLEGTRTGRQEIEAELLEDVEGALWTKSQLDQGRIQMPPGWQDDDELAAEMMRLMRRIVVSVDPNTTSGEAANDAGIIVCGQRHADNHGIVLDDRTVTRGGPRAWSSEAVDAYHDWKADLIVVEVNNGGEMCKEVIAGVDPTVPVKMITASRGKRTRAEPVANLYTIDEAKEVVARIHHAGVYPELEDEQTTWTPEDESPNRMDALVWGMHELKLSEAPGKPYRRGQGLTKARLPTAADRFAGTSM